MNHKPLPRRPAPFRDELLSSWIARLADANYCAVPELCRYLGLAQERPLETQSDLAGVDIDGFCATIRLPPEELDSMLIHRRADFPVECISWSDFQNCPVCTHEVPGISLRHWRFAWSLQCEVCGSDLLPLRGEREGLAQLPSRLRRRSEEGARRLKIAYQQRNIHSGRRIDLTLQVAALLAPEFRQGSLFYLSRLDRCKILAAINLGMTRPLLATALVLKIDTASEARLRAAFPYKRKLVDRIERLAKDLPSRDVKSEESHKNRIHGVSAHLRASPQPEYLEAARLAIAQLGVKADRGELLRHAERVLRSARQRSVDIQ